MRALMITAGTLIFAAGVVAGGRLEPLVGAQGFTSSWTAASSAPQLRTTLYFRLARPKGAVTELEWQLFLRDEVTTRFPAGLTVWEAEASGGHPLAASITSSRRSCSGPSRYGGGAAIGPRRYRGVSQDVRAAIRSVGKRARVWRGLVTGGLPVGKAAATRG